MPSYKKSDKKDDGDKERKSKDKQSKDKHNKSLHKHKKHKKDKKEHKEAPERKYLAVSIIQPLLFFSQNSAGLRDCAGHPPTIARATGLREQVGLIYRQSLSATSNQLLKNAYDWKKIADKMKKMQSFVGDEVVI